MGLSFCMACLELAQREKHYLSGDEVRVEKIEDCAIHPRLDNWRVWRTLRTIQYWGNQPVGWRDKRAPTTMSLGNGWVHRRNAEVILFDYEKPILDFLVSERLLEEVDCNRRIWAVDPRAIRLTAKGDSMLLEKIHAGEATK